MLGPFQTWNFLCVPNTYFFYSEVGYDGTEFNSVCCKYSQSLGKLMHYIRHMWNATSESNVEPKSNFECFGRRFDKVVFNSKLSNLVDSDVPSQSSYLSTWIRHLWKSMIELGNDKSVQYY